MAQVNWTKQAILAGALFTLGSATYWLEYKHRPEKESREEQNKKLFNLKDLRVNSVALQDGIGHTYEVRCSEQNAALCKPGDHSKWELTQPLKLKADEANANALISALNNLTSSEVIELKEETPEKRSALLKEYGLDAPSRAQTSIKKIEVATPNGATVLYLGLNHPIGETIFAVAETVGAGQKPTGKVDETKVYLVPNYFKSNFDHDLNYWRDKKLMTVSAHEIDEFTLLGSKTKIHGVRKNGQWTLNLIGKTEEFPGDIEGIDNVLTAATYLTAKSFVADTQTDPKAQLALKGAKKALSLTLRPEKGTAKEAPAPVTLTLFQKSETSAKKAANAKPLPTTKLYATVSTLDPVYELDANSIERLDKEFKSFRLAKLLTSMERFGAKRVEFTSKALGNTPLVLKNQDGKWSIEGEKTEPNNDKVQNFLDRISGNRIQDFTTSIPPGEADGTTIKFADEKGGSKRQLVFWKNGGKLYARDLSSQKKEVFIIDPVIENELPRTRDYFIKKETPAGLPTGMPSLPQAPNPLSGAAGAPPEPGKPLIPVPEPIKKK